MGFYGLTQGYFLHNIATIVVFIVQTNGFSSDTCIVSLLATDPLFLYPFGKSTKNIVDHAVNSTGVKKKLARKEIKGFVKKY